jgi:hypothetical protein
MVSDFADQVRRHVRLEDRAVDMSDSVSVDVWRAEEQPATEAELTAVLLFPSGQPSAWIGESLLTVDRAFRWAVRATERRTPVDKLMDSHARPVGTESGLVIDEVHAGSLRFISGASERLDRALVRRPVVYTLALIQALQLLGLNPHIEFWDDPGAPQPPPPAPIVNVTNNAEFSIVLVVDGQRVTVRCRPAR